MFGSCCKEVLGDSGVTGVRGDSLGLKGPSSTTWKKTCLWDFGRIPRSPLPFLSSCNGNGWPSSQERFGVRQKFERIGWGGRGVAASSGGRSLVVLNRK